MIYYMHSKTFFDSFINKEDDNTILKANYVCVSTHIRKRDTAISNVITLQNVLYPGSTVFNCGSFKEMKNQYFNQLEEEAESFLASLIYASIHDNMNIILICTKQEYKLKYIKWLAEFMFYHFGYPVYPYKEFINGCGLIEYDKEKILKKTKKIVEENKERKKKELQSTKFGKKKLYRMYKDMSKDELKKEVKKQGLYIKGMSKGEMLDMLEAFL